MGNSGFVSSCNRGVRSLLESRRRTWGSSLVATGDLGFHSSCGWEHCVPLKLQHESWGSFQVTSGYSELPSSCGRISGFLSSCSMGHRVPLEPWQGTWGSSRVGVFRVHLEFPWGLLSTSLGASRFLQGCAGWVLSVAMCGCILTGFGMGLYYRNGQGQLWSCVFDSL